MNKKAYFVNLDGFRFIAAMSVVLLHLNLRNDIDKLFVNDFLKHFFYFFTQGGTAVSFFFVLSGFLISSILIAEKKNKGSINFKQFYIRRGLRIWPLYFLTLIISFYFLPWIMPMVTGDSFDPPNNPLYYFFFLSNFDLINLSNNNLIGGSPLALHLTWSVAIEEQFYLIWPILINWIKINVWFFIALMIIPIIYRVFDNSPINEIHSLNTIGDFAVGGLAAYISLYKKNWMKYFQNINVYLNSFIYVFFISYIMFSDLMVNEIFIHMLNRTIITVFFAYLILEQNNNQFSFYKMANFKMFTRLSLYTYGIYLLHPYAIELLKIIIPNMIIIKIIAIPFIILVAYISYTFFERKFIQLKKHIA